MARVKSRERGRRFNVARVQKPLASAAEVVEAGNESCMGPNPDDNYIMNDATGEKIALRIDRETFVFDVEFQDGEVGTITLDSGAGVNVWHVKSIPPNTENSMQYGYDEKRQQQHER